MPVSTSDKITALTRDLDSQRRLDDNPQAYGCLYVAEDPASVVAEASVETLSVDHEATREASTRLGLA